jgi:acyl-CoA hydrolase
MTENTIKPQNAERPTRPVSYSKTESIHILRYQDINGAGRLYGGTLLGWIDEIGAMTAIRHCGGMVTTASIDNLEFKRGAYLNELVVLVAKITYVGNSSMEIRVDTYVEDLNGFRNPINRAYLTYVCIGDDGKPARIPYDIEFENEGERAENESAKLRRENRKFRKKEGF